MEEEFAAVASLLAEPTRAVMLLTLLSGKALPAGELAGAANISAQTASGHLAKLIRANLLEVHQQGRHRYYRLARREVADALEAMLVLLPEKHKNSRSAPPTLGTVAYARTCYSHLAGWLGVRVADALLASSYLRKEANRRFAVTEAGYAWFSDIGIHLNQTAPHTRRALQCMDWTERRPHLAGTLGVELHRRFVDLHWLAPLPDTRAVRVTLQGKEALWKHLRIALA